ncbi:MAG: helix-turn-helix transcriptional regulator, partial [Chloroflexi bacterium]|nr:helix-turn-helix transcriptional regulator [Chloroflexota bacterium]
MQERYAERLPELLRGNTETLLLFLIDTLGAAYGYQMIKEIEKRSRGFFQFKEGTVYPALRKLENEGLIQGEWQEATNRQERRYYRLTEKGKEEV